jgi:hypothetical protein
MAVNFYFSVENILKPLKIEEPPKPPNPETAKKKVEPPP